MARFAKLAPGFTSLLAVAVIGCGAPDDRDDKTTEQKQSALTTTLFQPYLTYPTGSWPEAVAIGDLDGDGRNDVALVTSRFTSDPANDYMVHVFLQAANGSLKPRVRYPIGGDSHSIDIGDVNGDGRADVVVGVAFNAANPQISVLLQNAAGTLDPMVSYPTNSAAAVKVGDFNSDGRLDIAALQNGAVGDALNIYLQTGTGALASPVTYHVPHGGGDELDAGDIDGDGRTDVVVMSGGGLFPNVSVLLQTPDGALGAPTSYSVGGNLLTGGVAVGDTNGDGRTDIVVSYGGNRPSASIGRFLQNAQGAFDPVVSYASYDIPDAIVLADVDGDGRKDALVTHSAWQRLGVYRQFPSGDFLTEELYTIPYADYEPQGLAVGDINGDGRPDVAIADNNNGLVVLPHVADVSLGLAISAPVGGTYYPGLPITARWGVGDQVAVTGFDAWQSLTGPIAGCTGLPAEARECTFVIPGLATNAHFRVTAKTSGGQTVSAESIFNVVTPSLTVSGPIGPFMIGNTANIIWGHNLPPGNTVRIEVTRDGGATFETIAAAVPLVSGTNTYNWTVTGPATSTARVRVTANGTPSPSGTGPTNFTIVAPTLTVTAPAAGAALYTSSLPVAWTSNVGSGGTVRIELSRDGGATFETVAAAAPNTGTFTGPVGGASAADARVRVTTNGSVVATSTSASFTLFAATLAVTSPDAGSKLYIGNAQLITWSSNLPPTALARIDLSLGCSSTFQTLASNVPNSGSYLWTITGPSVGLACFRVTVTDAATITATGPTFSIPIPFVSVTSPAGGTAYVGTPLTIGWTSTLQASATMRVELSRDGGSTYQTLADPVPNSGSYTWTVTGPDAANARVRVSSTSPVVTAGASGSFAIGTPTLSVTSPIGGTAYAGTQLAIGWTSNLPVSGTVRVELSRDGGGTYETLASAAPNSGSFAWRVAGPDATNAIVRVSSNGAVAVTASSAGFAIATATVSVTSPVAGAAGYAGTPLVVAWSTNLPASATARIELSRDGGGTYEILADGAPNTGSFTSIAAGPDTAAGLVRVTVTGPASAVGTSGLFAVVTPTLALISPVAGTALAGTALTVGWSSNLPVESVVRIELSRDGGATFETLADAAPNTGGFVWAVAGPDTGAARVRVSIAGPVAMSVTSDAFAIATPALTVTSPAAGSSAYAGTSLPIGWTSNLPAGGTVRIDLTRDGGATYETLAAAAPNSGSFVWTAAGPDTATAVVRVTATDPVMVAGIGAAFSIVSGRITVTAPGPGASWAIGTSQTIAWTNNLADTVRVELSRDGGASYATLAASAPATGSLAWAVVGPATATAIVRVSSNGAVPASGTSAPFPIGSPAVTVTSPAGATWTIGVPQTITWTNNLPSTATVKIQLSRNGGSTFTNLTTTAPNTGSFAWTPTGAATTTALIKVTVNGTPSAVGTSGPFTLAAAAVTVTSPNSAVTWSTGSVQAITWTHNLGAGADFKIELTRDGGSTWSVILASVPGGSDGASGSYSWTVTGPATKQARIRVTSNGSPTVTDKSDVAFKIQ